MIALALSILMTSNISYSISNSCGLAWKKQRRICMHLVQLHTQGSSAPYLRKHLRNSRVCYFTIEVRFIYKDCAIVELPSFRRTLLIVLLHFLGLPSVLWVLPDSYIDVKNKDYGGLSFSFANYIFL